MLRRKSNLFWTRVGQNAIFTSVKSVEEKIPIGVLSAGVSKYLNILLAVADTPKGVVLVDEIENGFYYQKFPMLMRTIVDVCETENVQLFASSHSMEFLRSLLPAMQEKPNLYSLIRTEQTNGACSAKQFRGKDLIAALEQQIDVR